MTMEKQLEKDFKENVISAEREALVAVIRQNPDATLTELYNFIGGIAESVPKGITIGDVLNGVLSPKAKINNVSRKPKQKTKANREPKTKAKQKTKAKRVLLRQGSFRSDGRINTRTQFGRRDFDGRILIILQSPKGKKWSAKGLCDETGATNLQVRSSMGRLIEEGHADWQGQTNQMRYFAV